MDKQNREYLYTAEGQPVQVATQEETAALVQDVAKKVFGGAADDLQRELDTPENRAILERIRKRKESN